jgi:HD-GYP domain-containing protein (c-di-GMP phosphodiesterase class II)
MEESPLGTSRAPARPLARLKAIALFVFGLLIAGGTMYVIARLELERVAHGAGVGGAATVIILTILTLMAAFSALCGVGFHRVIFRPLSELNSVISRRAAGERDARLRWNRVDEIGTIGSNFDAMVDAISEGEDRLREFAGNAVRALALCVDAKDPYTRNHSERVARFAAAIAEGLRFDPDHVEQVRTAGLLHDVGKIAVPDAILISPRSLTDEEYAIVKLHSAAGERMIDGSGMHEIAPWVRAHHERFDGRGYPDGLVGTAIPLEGRILAVADSFEAMTSDRYFRVAMSVPDALSELQRCAGSQFDPSLVPVMVKWVISCDDLAPPASDDALPQILSTLHPSDRRAVSVPG